MTLRPLMTLLCNSLSELLNTMSSYFKTNCPDKKRPWVHALHPVMQTCFGDYGRNNALFSNNNPFNLKILWWGRYIDDLILLFFPVSHKELLVKLLLEYDHQAISFLDLHMLKDHQGCLRTSIFRKATDRNTTLHVESFHSPWLIKNIQIQRLKCICDSYQDFQVQSIDIHQCFRWRGY